MTEREWLACSGLRHLLRYACATGRKWRLVNCAWCRRLWALRDEQRQRELEVDDRIWYMTTRNGYIHPAGPSMVEVLRRQRYEAEEHGRRAVEAIERFADGLLTRDALEAHVTAPAPAREYGINTWGLARGLRFVTHMVLMQQEPSLDPRRRNSRGRVLRTADRQGHDAQTPDELLEERQQYRRVVRELRQHYQPALRKACIEDHISGAEFGPRTPTGTPARRRWRRSVAGGRRAEGRKAVAV